MFLKLLKPSVVLLPVVCVAALALSQKTGLESVLKSFYVIVDDVKRKPYDLLDYSRNQFDRDYLEFNVNIHDLEISLQVWHPAAFATGAFNMSPFMCNT